MYTALLLLLLVAMSRTKANSRVLTPRQAPRQPRLACNPLAATPSRTLTQPPLSVTAAAQSVLAKASSSCSKELSFTGALEVVVGAARCREQPLSACGGGGLVVVLTGKLTGHADEARQALRSVCRVKIRTYVVCVS